MDKETQRKKAILFRELHFADDLLLLPNAWDAMSAKLFEQAGAKAIGTTSAGIAGALGFADGQKMPRSIFLSAIERIIVSVDVPVTVDLEAGYGATIGEVCDMVQQIIKLGAVGINIEDTDFSTEPNKLARSEYQSDKITSIKTVAKQSGIPLFINARSDVYWLKEESITDNYAETIRRFSSYVAAGADGVFIHGIPDLAVIRTVCQDVKVPVNVLAGTWISSLNELKKIGVARISIGSGMFRATAAFIQQATDQYLIKQDFKFLEKSIPYHDVCNIFNK